MLQADLYYRTPEISHRQELILHLLEYSNHLILIKGEKHSGKTSLFDELSASDDSGLSIVKLKANDKTNEKTILNAIMHEKNTDLSFDDLEKWLKRCNTKQQIPALIIDDVDHLPDEILKFLFYKVAANSDDAIIHICLFCEPDFLDNLKAYGIEQEENQSLHIIEMPAFTEKQTILYLQQRYPDSNSSINILDEKTIKQIHRISHGLPGRINTLVEQYLNDPAEQKSMLKPKRFSSLGNLITKNRSIIIVCILLLSLSTAITLLLHKVDEPTMQTEPIKIALPLKETKGDALESLPELVDETLVVELKTIKPVDIEELALPVIPELVADVDLGKQQKRIEIFEGSDTPIVVKEKQSETIVEIEEEIEPIVVEAVVEEPQDTILDEEALEAKVDITAEEVIVPEVVQHIDESKAEEPKKDSQWIMQQKPSDYVIQLIGAKEQATIDVYLKKLPQHKDRIVQLTTTNAGKPWFILIYGHYLNRQLAVKEIEKLPEVAKNLSPWPRTIKSLQELDIKH